MIILFGDLGFLNLSSLSGVNFWWLSADCHGALASNGYCLTVSGLYIHIHHTVCYFTVVEIDPGQRRHRDHEQCYREI